jgi:hypothetical protein
MREIMPGGNYEGIWRRRGDSDIYDGLWVHVPTGNVTHDVLSVQGVENGELVIARLGMQGSYRAKLNADGSLGRGRASWINSAKYSWRPLPAQQARGVNLGPVLHMREVTFEGDYEGIWRRRPGRGNLYDALWVHVPTGELSADILIVTGVYRGRLVIQRYNAKGEYSAPLSKEGRLGPGTATWAADAGYHWLVLPAQKVKVLPPETGTALPDAASPAATTPEATLAGTISPEAPALEPARPPEPPCPAMPTLWDRNLPEAEARALKKRCASRP